MVPNHTGPTAYAISPPPRLGYGLVRVGRFLRDRLHLYPLIEGLVQSRTSRSAIRQLESACMTRDAGYKSFLSNAIETFESLDEVHRAGVIRHVQKRLTNTPILFEFGVLASFLVGAGHAIPPETKSDSSCYSSIVSSLIEFVEHGVPKATSDNSGPRLIVKTLSLHALWNIGYRDSTFWEKRVLDTSTRKFAITKLLDTGSTGFGQATSGWSILAKCMETYEVGIAIAESGSENTLSFFMDRYVNGDEGEKIAMLMAAIYVIPMPASFVSAIESIRSDDPTISKYARSFRLISDIFAALAVENGNCFMEMHALIEFYLNGHAHLHPKLKYLGARMTALLQQPTETNPNLVKIQKTNAISVLTRLESIGIVVPEFDSYRAEAVPSGFHYPDPGPEDILG